MDTSETQSQSQFEDTPVGWANRWTKEFDAAKKEVKQWQGNAQEIVKRFRDEKGARNRTRSRLNLFTANIQTLRALLYGKVPSVDVTRRFADSGDHVARVSAEMLQRLLNTDIEEGHDSYAAAIEHALDDRLIAGIGNVKVRYEVETEENEVPPITHPETGEELAAGYTEKVTTEENAEVEYFHWNDQLWSPSRVFGEVRWWAFRTKMSREKLIERFGEDIGKAVPLNSKRDDKHSDNRGGDPWSRADVWEIWSKDDKKVHWFVEGFAKTLDQKNDPLELEGFWPFPRPMFANLTTSALIPTPDYMLAKDLYEEIDDLEARISALAKSVKVAGVYNKIAKEISRLLGETVENCLIPVENWGIFAEGGGLSGMIDWMPMDKIVAALDKLKEHQLFKINQLFQVTGMSDIMRGQAEGTATATEQSIKAKFASVRVQALQDEFARFASDIQKIKAEIISKHFDPQTIVERSNIQFTPDAPMAEQAVQLIKSQFFLYRIEVKPEAVSLTDYASVKQERSEAASAIGGLIQSAMPMMQMMPESKQYVYQVMQWVIAGFRGSSSLEAIFDQAISAEQKAQQQAQMMPPQPPPPDPKLLAIQAKAQGDQAKTQTELQAHLVKSQSDVQTENQKNMSNAHWNIVQAQGTERAKAMAELNNITRPAPGGVP